MLATRIWASLAFAPAMAGLIAWGRWPLALACWGLSLLMLKEYLHLSLGAGQRYLKSLALVLGSLVCAGIVGWIPPDLQALLAPGCTLMLLSALLVRPAPMALRIQQAALVALGVLYGAGLLPWLVRLRNVPDLGLGIGLMALLCAWGSDTGAYFTGRFLGRHPLCPALSPRKTVEGSLGGLLWAVAVAWLIRSVFKVPLSGGHTTLIALIASILGGMGDLCESLLKRSVGAKDSSQLIPGHGGVLDRFDGVMFAVPAIYIYIKVMA